MFGDLLFLLRFLLFLFIIKSPKQRLETYFYLLLLLLLFSFLSLAQISWTEFHETWWSYRYMFLVGSKVFVVKGVKVIF
jgi:hypothetical protein